jgi:NAD+ kinase|tara:strand:+ start:2654 stop:3535 length:882 start_codon:yes stop_codon:yes gene_type:complete
VTKFNSIGLIAKIGNAKIIESLQRLERYLAAQDVKVTLETTTARFLPDCSLQSTSQEQMGSRCDLVIVVGGDGVILGAARTLAPFGVPILGINRGRLGFLADVSPDDIESKVGDVLAGKYTPEDHFLLEGEVVRDGAVIAEGCALNDVVMHPGELPRMLEFDLHIDDQFVYKQYSDGLIISTPTGSTAYSLSAGGPIMHPSLDAIVLVPMFPHTLSSRPIVVSGQSEIRIVMGSDTGTVAQVSFDSQVEINAGPGESILVRQRPDKLKLIHPPGHSFYEVCRSKLDWGSRLGE